MKTFVEHVDPDVERALTREVVSWLEINRPKSFRARWRFACIIVYAGLEGGGGFTTIVPPFDVGGEEVESEVDDTLACLAALVDTILNPPEARPRRVFIVTAVLTADGYSGRGITNAADEEALHAALRVVASAKSGGRSGRTLQ